MDNIIIYLYILLGFRDISGYFLNILLIFCVQGPNIKDNFTALICFFIFWSFTVLLTLMILFHFVHYLHTFVDTQFLGTCHSWRIQTSIVIICSSRSMLSINHTTRRDIKSSLQILVITNLRAKIIIFRVGKRIQRV